VPFVTFHLDDQPLAVRVALQGMAPAVVAEIDGDAGSVVLLLGPEALQACEASPERMLEALVRAVGAAGLTL
jgi:hypothetical protein